MKYVFHRISTTVFKTVVKNILNVAKHRRPNRSLIARLGHSKGVIKPSTQEACPGAERVLMPKSSSEPPENMLPADIPVCYWR